MDDVRSQSAEGAREGRDPEEAAGTAHQGDHSDLDPGRARLVEDRDDAGVGMGDEHRPPARAVQSRQQAQSDPLGTAHLRRVRVVDHRPSTLRGLGRPPEWPPGRRSRSRRPARPPRVDRPVPDSDAGSCRPPVPLPPGACARPRGTAMIRCSVDRTRRRRQEPRPRRCSGDSADSLRMEPKEAHRSPALRHVIGRQGCERLVVGLVGDRLGRVHELDPGRQQSARPGPHPRCRIRRIGRRSHRPRRTWRARWRTRPCTRPGHRSGIRVGRAWRGAVRTGARHSGSRRVPGEGRELAPPR